MMVVVGEMDYLVVVVDWLKLTVDDGGMKDETLRGVLVRVCCSENHFGESSYPH